MLYGVGLGPGDKKLLTLKAVEVIENSDEVIVPGSMAFEVIKDIRKPRIFEFLMGKGIEASKELGKELAKRSEEVIAFCCLGDPTLYSTFHHLWKEVTMANPEAEVEIIPGITSASSALAKSKTFVDSSMHVTSQDFYEEDTIAVMKAKKPKEIEQELRKLGYNHFVLLERMYTEEERITDELPEKASYFSVLVGKKQKEG